MRNKVHVLAEGYSRADTTDAHGMRANCSCCLVQTHNGRNIIVDTMTAWDGKAIVGALEKHGLGCEDIHYVVCTHGHSDHVGCNYLFLNAEWHFVGSCKSHADKYPDFNLNEPFALVPENVVIIATPGHTLSCVSVVVYNGETTVDGIVTVGTIGLSGDLFEREEDIHQSNIWLDAGSEDPRMQRENRLKLAEKCSVIIPGHGKTFQLSEEMRCKLRKDLNENFK